jgi:hypothetical protein
VARPRGLATASVGRLVRQLCPHPLSPPELMDEEMDTESYGTQATAVAAGLTGSIPRRRTFEDPADHRYRASG